MNIRKEDDRLFMEADKQPSVELFPESETGFFLKVADVQVSFNKNENNEITGLTLNQRGQKMVAKRVESTTAMSSERLAEFVGDYYSDELQVTYTIVLDEAQMSVTAPRDFHSPMRHVEDDTFAMSRGDITFLRNDRGRITGFTLDVRTERLSFSFVKKEETE
jgi:hypothetical protein